MRAVSIEPSAIHIGDDQLPWVRFDDGIEIKVLVAKVQEEFRVIRSRFAPGVRLQTHRHTGQVFGYTFSGAWRYLESDFVNTAQSFLYEPAGSRHTLVVPEENTELTDVWFQTTGANLNLDPDGNVESITDAASILEQYLGGCEELGITPTSILTD